MSDFLSRRGFLATGLATGALAATVTPTSAAKSDPSKFRYCLNTSTIRGQKLPLDQEIDLAANAGTTASSRGFARSTLTSKAAAKSVSYENASTAMD